MQYRMLTENDADFLTRIFSVPEYNAYFAENDTTKEEWRERLTHFQTKHSYVISKSGRDIGWIMYTICGDVCNLDIIVLLPQERNKGYGTEAFADLIARNPQVRTIKLDVQQRNEFAFKFYKKLGFKVIGEEEQLVNEENVTYLNMVFVL